MAVMEVLDLENKRVGEVELSSEIFEQPVREDLINTVVKWQRAKRRQGTHMAKTRSLVSGGGAKPYRQKGTGNARRGSSRSPLIRGGGVIFGPSPRNYEFSVPKKIKRAAVKSALSYLYSQGKIKVVDKWTSEEGKTNKLSKQLSGLGLKKSVLIGTELDHMVERASQNLPTYIYQPVAGMNVYDLLKYDFVVFEQDSLNAVAQRLGLEA